MRDTEEFIRAVYRMADADVLDVEGWRNAFTEDGVFSVAGRDDETFRGQELSRAITFNATVLPDLHRELIRVNVMDHVVAVETMTYGTHLGPFPTPDGPIPPTGATISVPSADFIYLHDGKIATFKTYLLQNVWFAQLGVRPDFTGAIKKSANTG
ncbi:nuclear transport factor 2 family protein [Mycobacteriaceae bacterium NPDC060252]